MVRVMATSWVCDDVSTTPVRTVEAKPGEATSTE